MVDVERRELVAQSLATRGTIRSAGAFGEDRFIVSTGGLFEEWDGRTRKPARRVQLSRPAGGDPHRRQPAPAVAGPRGRAGQD